MPLPLTPTGTNLVLYSPMGIPFYSARDLEQTLEAIGEKDQAERNINGNLVNLAIPGLFEKYSSTVTCTDMTAPMIGGIWQGQTLVMDCCCEIAYPSSVMTPPRPLATGTSVRDDGNGSKFIYPKLTVMLRKINQGFKEWPHTYNWSLAFEEV